MPNNNPQSALREDEDGILAADPLAVAKAILFAANNADDEDELKEDDDTSDLCDIEGDVEIAEDIDKE
eukprot:jgi/Psemu1/19640/gm1.19640_g